MTASNSSERLYLDHAATSWPKHPGMVQAMCDYLTHQGATAGRGGYASARAATDLVDQTRLALANAIGASNANCITFHGGCTAALNAAIHGVLSPLPSPHVITTHAEHNSVLRPIANEVNRQHGQWTLLPCDQNGRVVIDDLADLITEQTQLVAVTHASNVTGALQPVEKIVDVVRQANQSRPENKRIWVLCDAAQTFGYLPINVEVLDVDLLAAPAHKGGGGPPGIAMLYAHRRTHSHLATFIQGGSGSQSESLAMPSEMPSRLEAGTLNLPAIAGWHAELSRRQADEQATLAWAELANYLYQAVESVPGIRVIGQPDRLPILSLQFDRVGGQGTPLLPSDVATILDLEFGIEIRAGLHCSPLIHQNLGTTDGGTLRVSCGHGTTRDDIDRLVAALREIVG